MKYAFAGLLCLMASAAAAQVPPPPAGPPVVVASGEATVSRAPDRAYVTFATETRAPRPDEAQKRNAEAMAKVQQAVKKAKIPSDAVRTLAFNLREDVDWVNGRRTSRGYVVTDSIEVKVDDIDDLGELLDAAVEAGASNVSDIRFDLKDRAGAEREALRLAVADARSRADAAASGAGLRVERIIRIEEGERAAPPPIPVMRMKAMAATAGEPETPVAAGEIEIRATVTLTAAIDNR
jgi:uncharacterized protein